MQTLTQLEALSLHYLHNSLAPSTARGYTSAMRAYKHFCIRHNVIAFPVSERTLMLFATHLASYSSHSNIKKHMAAIKHFSIIKGFITSFRGFERLYLLIRGVRRAQGTAHSVPQRRPITPPMLRTIRNNLFNSSRFYEDKIMIWAAITTAFFGFLRVSEYTSSHKSKFDPQVTLLTEDITLDSSTAKLLVKASKTDPFREGMYIRIAANDTELCPIHALRTYLPHHSTRRGPLFAFRDGKFLTANDINKILHATTHGAANISSHSLRIGAASTAAAMGCPKWLIQGMGRWTSDCFRRYIRISDDTIRSTSKSLAICNVPVPNDLRLHDD